MKYGVLASALFFLGGCTTHWTTLTEPVAPVGVMTTATEDFDPAQMAGKQTVIENEYTDLPPPSTPMLLAPKNNYSPHYSHKKLHDYAEQIAMNLMSKAKMLNIDTKLAVASFVNLDSSLRTSSVLGNQLAESFINEMQAYGVSVVDFKLMPQIVVTESGDFVFTRSAMEMMTNSQMDYVLTGTLQQNEKGVLVNARIVNFDSQVVVSSATGFIPHFIVSSLTPEYLLL